MSEEMYWVTLNPKLEEKISTQMFDDIRSYLESELRTYLKMEKVEI